MLTDADKKPAVERPRPLSAKNIEISGIVQGVGFRPFIYQLARRHGLNGRVVNTSSGVTIRVEGSPDKIKNFLNAIGANAPPLARITGISSQTVPPSDFRNFIISQSQAGAQRATLIAPDMSVCPDCLAELFDPADRRYGYPFINCTNCGPRYTIIDDVPYDRPNTSMKHFTMCPDCQAEYDDPDNRRFHAQPNACPVCGPRLRLFDNRRNEITDEDPIPAAASLLKQGRILAIKGLGGFHLAVDAQNAAAVARLRRRKHRAEKPFALMSPDVKTIRQYARVNQEEERLLTSLQRPIVLLEKTASPLPAEAVSPGNRYFGVMLPYTPPHYLLLSHGLNILVMTSANLSEEPIAIDNQEAFTRLSEIADFFLTHDRDIYLRTDDSITRHLAGADRFIRRSRGYVPAPLLLNHDLPPILACGAELKSTICLTKNNLAFLSQHIGDLENLKAFDFFRQTVAHLKRILDIEPEIIACDMHPGYLSTRYALEQTGARLTQVQHHHAHIASCLAENGLDGPVIGLALDGTGYGTDGHIWGGEILVAEAAGFERPAHLAYVPMPGGEAAIREPWRMGISYLLDTYGEDFDNLDLAFLKKIARPKLRVIRTMVSQGLNSPLTSSLGRLFDGVAAILGCGLRVSFEGQAAMALEMMAGAPDLSAESNLYGGDLITGHVREISTRPLISGIVADLKTGVSPAEISTRFHLSLVRMYAALCDRIRSETDLNRVALSGGVFQNALFLKGLLANLEKKGFRVFTPSLVPVNDGGISLGQALVAAAETKK